jgi:hypothetical protein
VRKLSLPSLRRLCAAPLFIALLSAVMLAGVQDASCEMHGLGAARAVATPAHHGAAAVSSHETGDGEHGRGPAGCDCTCVGACTISAPLATPPFVATLRVALVEPEPRVSIGVEPSLVPPRAPDRLLPFANGPPTATV